MTSWNVRNRTLYRVIQSNCLLYISSHLHYLEFCQAFRKPFVGIANLMNDSRIFYNVPTTISTYIILYQFQYLSYSTFQWLFSNKMKYVTLNKRVCESVNLSNRVAQGYTSCTLLPLCTLQILGPVWTIIV